MSKTEDMQNRDDRMFNGIIREHVYRGPDKSLLSKGEMTAIKAVDHGARPLIGKFSPFNLSFLLPEQRKVFLEQMKFELSLTGEALNQYLSARYTDEDMYKIWEIEQKANRYRKHKIGKPINNAGRKRRIVNKMRKPLTPEQLVVKIAKAKATRERNAQDPNYISYNELKKAFQLRQKMLVKRSEIRTKQGIAIYANEIIKRKVYSKTCKLELENKRLKEFIKQNHLHLPGSVKEQNRRSRLREQ